MVQFFSMVRTLQRLFAKTMVPSWNPSLVMQWEICWFRVLHQSGESSLTLVRVTCLLSSRVVVERNPDGLPMSTLRSEARVKMQSSNASLAMAIYSTSRKQKKEEPLVTKVKEPSPHLAKLKLHTRKHHIVHLSSSMLPATQELHSYQTSMVLVLPPSMSGMSKELHSARLDLVSSSTWATLSREERITTVILPTLYSLLWIMVRLVPIQSTPLRSNLSLMIRLKVVRTRELLIL